MRRATVDLALIVAVALAANFAYFAFSGGDFYYPDSFTYLAPARSMLQGRGFLDQKGLVDTIRTPAYPVLLAIFGAMTLPLIVLQHLMNAALAAAMYLLVRRRIGSRLAAIVAAILLAIDTPAIHYANKLLSENTFMVLLFVTCAVALGKPRPVGLGILSGLLVLMRPIAIAYFVVLAIFLAVRRVSARQIAIFVAIALLLPVGWAARNAYRSGVFTISSIAGINMLNYRAAGALAMEDAGDDFRADLKDELNGLHEDADDKIQRQLHIDDAEQLSDAVRARFYSQYAWHVIAQHPLGFVALTIRGVLVNLFDSDWEAIENVSSVYAPILKLTVGVIPVSEFVFALIGIIALWKTDRALSLLLGMTIVYFIVMAAGAEAEARFRVPVIPEIAIAAAAGVEAARRGISAAAASRS